eukprot:jgi/Botrbrau1/2599/Bobra.145_1s0024.2
MKGVPELMWRLAGRILLNEVEAGPGPADGAAGYLECGNEAIEHCNKPISIKLLRILAILIILLAGSFGFSCPAFLQWRGISREHGAFLIIKAFGAGIILATGTVHMFMSAVVAFENPCLGWGGYNWAGCIVGMAIVATQLVEFVASKVVEKKIRKDIRTRASLNLQKAPTDEEAQTPTRQQEELASASQDLSSMYIHGHAHPEDEHGHDHNADILDTSVRHESIAIVLELGIAAHSIIIGIALGVSQTPCAMLPLFIALIFHQMFEGFALGACLVEV